LSRKLPKSVNQANLFFFEGSKLIFEIVNKIQIPFSCISSTLKMYMLGLQTQSLREGLITQCNMCIKLEIVRINNSLFREIR